MFDHVIKLRRELFKAPFPGASGGRARLCGNGSCAISG